MKKIFILTLIVGTLCNTAVAQSIQASIKAGAASNTVEIYFKPDFSNNKKCHLFLNGISQKIFCLFLN